MTGLDKIIAQINFDADNTIKSIISTNEAQCADIIAKADAEAKQILEDGETKARKKSEDIIRRAKSTAELEQRKILLRTKQEIIASMVTLSLESLTNLADDKYFEIICKMISKYQRSFKGTIAFNSSDLKRLPADFNQNLSKLFNGNLILSEEPANIDGGFILTYGSIDVNCCFSSLFSGNSEIISDAVAKLLFG